MNRYSPLFLRTVTRIENILTTYYGLSQEWSVIDFLSPVALEHEERGCLFIRQEEDALEISVSFQDDILKTLDQQNPLKGLQHNHLDALCVIIEEISHFHMILTYQNHQISQFHLEAQAEVDKLLITALLTEKQYGTPYIHALAYLLFDRAILPNNNDVYDKANKTAGDFWYRAIHRGLGKSFHLFSPAFRRQMLQNYRSRAALNSSHMHIAL